MGTKATDPDILWARLTEAVAYAFVLHGEQRRKGTIIPYIAHLMSVSALVLEHGGDEEQTIAGLLHDAIEDVGVEQEEIITERFGSRVAGIVRACTDADILPKRLGANGKRHTSSALNTWIRMRCWLPPVINCTTHVRLSAI
jgi:(p)ppGpp synthase/HD superfamily hydrolase